MSKIVHAAIFAARENPEKYGEDWELRISLSNGSTLYGIPKTPGDGYVEMHVTLAVKPELEGVGEMVEDRHYDCWVSLAHIVSVDILGRPDDDEEEVGEPPPELPSVQ